MSILKVEDKKKWLNAFLALGSVIIGFLAIRLTYQLGDWFDFEAKIKNFRIVAQGIGVLVGFLAFILVSKHNEAMKYLDEVYSELVKVIWPDHDSTIKMTIGIIVGIIFISGIFLFVDFIFRTILELLY